jgi:hypothetical protein
VQHRKTRQQHGCNNERPKIGPAGNERRVQGNGGQQSRPSPENYHGAARPMSKGNQPMVQVSAVSGGKSLPAYRASQNGKQHIEKRHAKYQ